MVEFDELEMLTNKIEKNTATLDDYKRYEHLLLKGGLSQEYIYSYLKRAGFSSWEDFVSARNDKKFSDNVGGTIVGALIGLGIALIIDALFSKD